MSQPFFEYRHVIGLEETNIVGNVYFAHYLRWQGRCRESFLQERAIGVLKEIQDDLKLFTVKVDCEYFAEATAFDQLVIRMHLLDLTQTQLEFGFDYFRVDGENEVLIARGKQRVACMRGENQKTSPTRVPEELVAALKPYGR